MNHPKPTLTYFQVLLLTDLFEGNFERNKRYFAQYENHKEYTLNAKTKAELAGLEKNKMVEKADTILKLYDLTDKGIELYAEITGVTDDMQEFRSFFLAAYGVGFSAYDFFYTTIKSPNYEPNKVLNTIFKHRLVPAGTKNSTTMVKAD